MKYLEEKFIERLNYSWEKWRKFIEVIGENHFDLSNQTHEDYGGLIIIPKA